MNRFKCLACGGNQYTACDTAEWCIYCGHHKLEKMDKLEPEESEGEGCGYLNNAKCVKTTRVGIVRWETTDGRRGWLI